MQTQLNFVSGQVVSDNEIVEALINSRNFEDDSDAAQFWCEDFELHNDADSDSCVACANEYLTAHGYTLQFSTCEDNDDELLWTVA